jgi:hypothetical protein
MLELKALLADHQLFHSDLQMDCFITASNGGTHYGQYKQALRELYSRYDSLKGLYAERELAGIDIDEFSQPPNAADTEFDERRRKVKLTQARMKLDSLARSIADSEREFRRFYAQCVALKKIVGELTPERRNELDREFWLHRLKSLAAIDVLSHGRVGPNVLTLAHSLPAAMRQDLWSEIGPGREGELVQWYLSEETPELELDRTLLDGQEPLALP